MHTLHRSTADLCKSLITVVIKLLHSIAAPPNFLYYPLILDVIYKKNIEEYNANKKRKILTVFYDKTADMLSNKKLNPIVSEILIRERKLNISLVFVTILFCSTKKY